MKLEDREVIYNNDSQRVKKPKETIFRFFDEIDERITIENYSHSLAPGLSIKKIESDNVSSVGKGISKEQVMASAIGEYVERSTLSNFVKENEAGFYGTLTSKKPEIPFKSLRSGDKKKVPLDMVDSSNGAATGLCIEEAIYHGLMELIERHEHAERLPLIESSQLLKNNFLKIKTVPKEIRKNFDRDKLSKILIVYSRSKICPKVHVFQALAFCRHKKSGFLAPETDIAIGMGANLDPSQALQRSLTELTQILAVNKDVQEIVKPEKVPKKDIDFSNLSNNFKTNLNESIEYCRSHMDRKIYFKDISDPKFSFKTVKCFVSGTKGNFLNKIDANMYQEFLNRDVSLIDRIMVQEKRVLK